MLNCPNDSTIICTGSGKAKNGTVLERRSKQAEVLSHQGSLSRKQEYMTTSKAESRGSPGSNIRGSLGVMLDRDYCQERLIVVLTIPSCLRL